MPLDENVAGGRSLDFAVLDEALTGLSAIDERQGRLVELRFFGGLSIEETAEVLKISAQSVMRDWKTARAWLVAELAK